ncbi:MAG: response regulator [Elusimicrobia bacterium]|nr:response regulator [Elusimicrobiota bacterium]
MKILICDDEYAARLVIKSCLAALPAKIFEASGGEEALEIVEKEHPDIMIIDYSMAGMTGLDIVRKVQGKLPVIVLTSEGFPEKTERELRKLSSGYMLKPVREDELIKMIQKISGRKSER